MCLWVRACLTSAYYGTRIQRADQRTARLMADSQPWNIHENVSQAVFPVVVLMMLFTAYDQVHRRWEGPAISPSSCRHWFSICGCVVASLHVSLPSAFPHQGESIAIIVLKSSHSREQLGMSCWPELRVDDVFFLRQVNDQLNSHNKQVVMFVKEWLFICNRLKVILALSLHHHKVKFASSMFRSWKSRQLMVTGKNDTLVIY